MNNYGHSQHISIKSWAEEDQPREKLIQKGRSALSDAELMAILLSSGSREESAVELAQRILNHTQNNLHELGRVSLQELMQFKGIGEAKAVTIAAALELGRRRAKAEPKERATITSSKDAYQELIPHLADLPHEEFWILLMDRANRVMSAHRISTGGVSGTVVDARMVFRPALEKLASGIILAHNHPSGALVPSQDDIKLTAKLKEAGKTLDVSILDHLIIGHKTYYSFADEGKL